jgi:hypothetical protein
MRFRSSAEKPLPNQQAQLSEDTLRQRAPVAGSCRAGCRCQVAYREELGPWRDKWVVATAAVSVAAPSAAGFGGGHMRGVDVCVGSIRLAFLSSSSLKWRRPCSVIPQQVAVSAGCLSLGASAHLRAPAVCTA